MLLRMKNTWSLLAAVCAVLFLAGCVPAVPNLGDLDIGTGTGGGSTADSGNGGGSPSGGGDADGWQLCKDTSYDVFDIQVWSGAGAVDYVNYEGYGRFTYNGDNGGWSGGGLVRAGANADASVPPFDMPNATRMTFEIRGTIDPKALCIALQSTDSTIDIFPVKTSLASYNVSTLSAENWTTVEIPFETAKAQSVGNAFLFVVTPDDWNGATTKGAYWEIRNLDWVDSSGNSVKLSIKES